MPFVVLYDANVLYPSTLRDVLIRVGMAGLVQAKWTEQILDETFVHLKENRPDLDPEKLDRTRGLMNRAIRDVLVTGYEPLIDSLKLPDPDDRHVLAAAIRSQAQVIVTFNLPDFPEEVLSGWDIEAKHPDDFLIDQFHIDALALHRIIQDIADTRKNADTGSSEVLDTLERDAPQTAAVLRR